MEKEKNKIWDKQEEMGKPSYRKRIVPPPPPRAPTNSLVEVKEAINLDNIPSLSKACLNKMPSNLHWYFKSEAGQTMWQRIYGILRHYCKDQMDFILVEDFAGLFCIHFSVLLTPYEKVFAVHQNELFACLQEWIRTWFDPLGAMRMRLRTEQKPSRLLKNSILLRTKSRKYEKKSCEYGFDDFNKDGEGLEFDFQIPDPPPAFLDDLVSWNISNEEIKRRRKELYNLLLLHFPLEGLTLTQLPMAWSELYGTPVDKAPIHQHMITKYMNDIVHFRQTGRNWRVIRLRFDVSGLKIKKKLLTKLKLINLCQNNGTMEVVEEPTERKLSDTAKNEIDTVLSPLTGAPELNSHVENFSEDDDSLLRQVENVSVEENMSRSLFEEDVVHHVNQVCSEPLNDGIWFGGRGYLTNNPPHSRVTPPRPGRGAPAARARIRRGFSTVPVSQGEHYSEYSPSMVSGGEKSKTGQTSSTDPWKEKSGTIQNLCLVLLGCHNFSITWTDLKKVPGFMTREQQKEVREFISKEHGTDILSVKFETEKDDLVIRLNNPSMFR